MSNKRDLESLFRYIRSKIHLSQNQWDLVRNYFSWEEIPAQTNLLRAGEVERYAYFLNEGIVKGYQNVDGEIVVQHLVVGQNFFTSLDSFLSEQPSQDYYETITACKLMRISKKDFDTLQKETTFWPLFVKDVINEHLNCKIERVKEFQTLTAKERYLKFVNQYPDLVLNVSVENIASFLGIKPQSLSRIRSQVAF